MPYNKAAIDAVRANMAAAQQRAAINAARANIPAFKALGAQTVPGATITGAEATAGAAPKAGFLRALGSGLGTAAKTVKAGALPAAVLSTPFLADPGSAGILARPQAAPGSNAANLADTPDDTGFEKILKAGGRGLYNIMDTGSDLMADTVRFFTENDNEANTRKLADANDIYSNLLAAGYDDQTIITYMQQEGLIPEGATASPSYGAPTGGEVNLTQDGGDFSALGGVGGIPSDGDLLSQGGEYVLPQQGRGGGSPLDNVLALLAGTMPQPPGDRTDINNATATAAFWQNLGHPDGPWIAPAWATFMADRSAGQLQNLRGEEEANAAYGQSVQDWLKNYTGTALDVEKEKRLAAEDDFKIHSTRGGFLVEMNEGGKKVLKPIAGFGDSKAKKFNVMGSNFTTDNPLAGELEVLQNLADVGILNDVLVENQEDLAEATRGITDFDQIQTAQILALARAMRTSPQLKAALQQKFVESVGQAPQGLTFDSLAAPQEGELDFLEQLIRGGQ